jgi:hypothetical protein
MKILKTNFSKFGNRLAIFSSITNIVFILISIIILLCLKYTIIKILIVLAFELTFVLVSFIYIFLNEYFSKLITSQLDNRNYTRVFKFCLIGILKSIIILLPALLICILMACHIRNVYEADLIISISQAILFCFLITGVSLINKK